MIEIYYETEKTQSSDLYPTAVKHSFDEHGNWLAIFDDQDHLLAAYPVRNVVKIICKTETN